MADFSEFNNNNYMPGFYGDMNSITQHNLAANLNLRGNAVPQPFTFTSPTLSSTMSTPRPSIQTTSQISYMGAPGVGTTWQHSVPTTMPWSNLASTVTQHGLSSFGDHPVMTPFNSTHATLEPQPSCSSPMKRPKRKALDYSEDAPMSKVYLCTDQFANLQISPEKKTEGDRQVRKISYSSHSNSEGKSKRDLIGWERFQEVENSIEPEAEDESLNSRKLASKQKGVICIDDKIIKESSTPSSILPKTVLDDITKPCLQVVLWKSPGQILRDVVKEETKIPSPGTPIFIPSSNSSSTLNISSRSGRSWLSSPLSSRDSVMEDTPSVLDTSVNQASPPTMHLSANTCLLSTSSPDLNWLNSSHNQLHLASSNQGEMPFTAFGNMDMGIRCHSDLLDSDMQL